jgi:amino-acid N-acetyltransferase
MAGKIWSSWVSALKPKRPGGSLPQGTPAVTLAGARDADEAAIESLLSGARLPAVNVRGGARGFLVARDSSRVVGCIGTERYGEWALLRSLAVLPELRRQGVGSQLLEAALDQARELGGRFAVLLTETAQGLAAKHGFVETARETLPPDIQSCWEMKIDCCRKATCMTRRL